MIIVLMGVSGVGKTTIGKLLAGQLGWPFYDGDEFHPQSNIDKMAHGMALTDEDRDPWLKSLRALIDALVREAQSAVIACSALKASYRRTLQGEHTTVRLVYLRGEYALVQQRLAERRSHFMTGSLLASQFADLEEPEDALTVDVAQSPETIVEAIERGLGLPAASDTLHT